MDITNLEFYNAPARAVAWSPWSSNNTTMLATAADKTVTVWNPTTGLRIFVDPDNQEPVSCIAFSNTNSGLLASAAGKEITLRRTQTWDEITRIRSTSTVTAIDFCCYHQTEKCVSPLLVYGTAEGSVAVFDINSKTVVETTVHPSQKVNTVKFFSFAHMSIVSTADREIVELELDYPGSNIQKISRRKTVSARKASTLLTVPYQPHGVSGGAPDPSIFKNDQKVGLISKKRRMDYFAIGRSVISIAKRQIEYSHAEEGTLARTQADSPTESVCWVANWPCNFVTGHLQDIVFWSVKIRHRLKVINHLIGWLNANNIWVEINPEASLKAHNEVVTAIAYPPFIRAGTSQSGYPWLLATASKDTTVKLWNISPIKAIRSNRTSFDKTKVQPEYVLNRALRGLGVRRRTSR